MMKRNNLPTIEILMGYIWEIRTFWEISFPRPIFGTMRIVLIYKSKIRIDQIISLN